LATVVLRAGAEDSAEEFLFCLNGWGDLPFLAKGLTGVPERFRVVGWLPETPERAAELATVESYVAEHVKGIRPVPAITVVGYSHAGLLALSAARALAERADTSVRLVIVETCAPDVFPTLPLDFEFFRSAPFYPPDESPVVDALRGLQHASVTRPLRRDDFLGAIRMVADNADHLKDLAVAADPANADLDPAALRDKLTEWLTHLLLLRGLRPDGFAGPTVYLQSKEGRQMFALYYGAVDAEFDAWRRYTPDLVHHRVGDRHWGMLDEDRLHELVFRLEAGELRAVG
jgi:thioesterase domain-containing protein